jgi:hypothetical protein
MNNELRNNNQLNRSSVSKREGQIEKGEGARQRARDGAAKNKEVVTQSERGDSRRGVVYKGRCRERAAVVEETEKTDI